MSNNTKKLIILTIILLALSGIFSCLKTGRFRIALPWLNNSSNNYQVKEKFNSASVEIDTGEVSFYVAKDGKARVVRDPKSKKNLSVRVTGGNLKISEKDRRPWFLRFGSFTEKSNLTVYLPEKTYKLLKVRTDTASVHLQDRFRFDKADIKTDTGSIHISSVIVSDDLKAESDTGSIHMNGIRSEDISVNTDTGSISLNNVIASDELKIKSNTGSVTLEKCDGGEISISTDTGRVKASLLSNKVFSVRSDTGSISVPDSGIGGKCRIETDTGSITVTIE